MSNPRLAARYIRSILEIQTGWKLDKVCGWEVIAALWPLNEIIRPRLTDIRATPYCADFEAEVDCAIEAFAFDRPIWVLLSAQGWRVLLERHQQTTMLALLSESDDTHFTLLPQGLPESAEFTVLMLQLLHSMYLPYPPEDRSDLVLQHELPQRPQYTRG